MVAMEQTMEERSYITTYARTIVVTKSTRAATDERTHSERTVVGTECAMAAMERTMKERSYTKTYGRLVVLTDSSMVATEEQTHSYHGRNSWIDQWRQWSDHTEESYSAGSRSDHTEQSMADQWRELSVQWSWSELWTIFPSL